jgi:hypothetical protein
MSRDVCCKTLKSEDERTLIDPDIIRDMYVLSTPFPYSLDIMQNAHPETVLTSLRSIIGLSDGLTVPFALTAGLSSIGSSRIVVLGGVAELIAGAISMGIGGFCMFLWFFSVYASRIRSNSPFMPKLFSGVSSRT